MSLTSVTIPFSKGKGRAFYFSFLFSRFFYSPSDEEQSTVATPVTSTNNDDDSFFGWLSGTNSDDPTSPSTTEYATTTENNYSMKDWIGSLFGMTPPPKTTTQNPLNNPNHWLAVLASHVATTTAKPTIKRPEKEASKRAKYDDYQIWRISPSTNAHLEFLREYKGSSDGGKIQWLKGPSMR